MTGTPRALVRSGVALLDAVSAPLFRAAGGNVRVGPVGLVELTTVGRRSGQPRSVFLTSYMRVGEGYLVVGTHGAAVRQPDWFYNISADPRGDCPEFG
ncbi:nitroreductase family deazaflavin-dependent oxidoreductase [Nocardia sp.]|uniref:nitroreductase family deazaflavin-dependent oxidoreductase n=1 Tax=Nocardia sp. TaxID=1821 RepID=UPI003452BB53